MKKETKLEKLQFEMYTPNTRGRPGIDMISIGPNGMTLFLKLFWKKIRKNKKAVKITTATNTDYYIITFKFKENYTLETLKITKQGNAAKVNLKNLFKELKINPRSMQKRIFEPLKNTNKKLDFDYYIKIPKNNTKLAYRQKQEEQQ